MRNFVYNINKVFGSYFPCYIINSTNSLKERVNMLITHMST